MTRPAERPGYQSKYDKELALGVAAAKTAQKNAIQKAKEEADRKKLQSSLKGIQNQIELLAKEKVRQSGQRTFFQNLYNNAILSGASAIVIEDYRKSYVQASQNIEKIDKNIAQKQDEYAQKAKGFKTADETYREQLRVEQAMRNAKNTKGNSSSIKNVSKKEATPPPKQNPIVFNAPMVKSAYFNSPSISEKSVIARSAQPMLAEFMSISTFGDGQTNRGFIVPNKKSIAAALSNMKEPKDKRVAGGFKTPHGFRFHYNPQFIDQTIGTLNGISPELLMSGKDQANMITTPTSSSQISFQLYLNRIEDMNALASYSLGAESKKINDNKDSLIHYPETVTSEHRKMIKNFGTMYDLEYLFRAVNGDMGGYRSPMRGELTADVGWLNGMAVEMHLGRKLRYLARIINISIKHILFTESMIPTLSIVSIQAHRFHDTTSIDATR